MHFMEWKLFHFDYIVLKFATKVKIDDLIMNIDSGNGLAPNSGPFY